MDYPDYEFYDTLCVSRRVLPDLENHQLQTVAAACGYCLHNHGARFFLGFDDFCHDESIDELYERRTT